MALTEKDGKFPEETKKVEQSPVANTPVDSQAQIIIELQAQVNQLAKQMAQPASTADQNGELAKALDKLGQNFSNGPINRETGQFIFNDTLSSMDEMDMEDILDQSEWITFASYMSFNVISTDRRNGRQVPAPFGPIKFQYDSTQRVQRGKDTEIINLCVYTCKSRKELEWLIAHSCYNITFFSSIKGALSEEAKIARRMASNLISLRSMGIADLRSMARQNSIEGIDGLSPEDVRATIAAEMAKKQEEGERQNQTRMLNATHLESELIKK